MNGFLLPLIKYNEDKLRTELTMFWQIEEKPPATILRFTIDTLNTTNSADVKTEFLGLMADGEKNLVVDLSGIKKIDSSGIGALLFGKRQAASQNGAFILISVSPVVMKLLKIGMLDRVFDIYDSEEDAVRAL